MNRKYEIEMKVVKAMVLDERMEWVPLSYQVSKEGDFRKHLEDGHVLHGNAWVTIAEAKGIMQQAALEHATALHEINLTDGYSRQDAIAPPPETSLFLDEQSLTETAQLQIPPELLRQPSPEPEEEFKLPESKGSGKMLAVLIGAALGVISVGAAAAYFLLTRP